MLPRQHDARDAFRKPHVQFDRGVGDIMHGQQWLLPRRGGDPKVQVPDFEEDQRSCGRDATG